ncbi:hypothetical protein EDD11_005052 [Mortierella claussenii]|nr:hypothetical protein EDD11_005052 [Mortierella claussenii]
MTLPIVRRVDNLERYNVARSNANIYHNVVVGNRIRWQFADSAVLSPQMLPSSPRTSYEWAQLLLDPITILLDRHPSLAVVLGDHLSANPSFLRLVSVNLSDVVQVIQEPYLKDAKDVARVLEEEHNRPFDLADQTRPLWRLVIAPVVVGGDARAADRDGGGGASGGTIEFYLLYTFHHVIGDGRSAMALVEQLVELLGIQARRTTRSNNNNNSSTNSTTTSAEASLKVPIHSDNSMPASIEARVDCSPSLRTILYEASRSLLFPGFVKKWMETMYWAGEVDSSLEVPNQTEVGIWLLTPEETESVKTTAKRRKTTVQAVLYTASVFAVKAVFMSDDDRQKQKQNQNREEAIVFSTPVSLRSLIPNTIAAEEQGNYTSEVLHTNIRVQDTSEFWKMTFDYRQEVVHATTTKRGLQELLEHFGMLSLLSKADGAWERFLKEKVYKDQHGRKATVKLSNLGQGWIQDMASGNKEGNSEDNMEFRIQDGLFSQSSGVTAAALTMNVVTACNRMTVTTTWQKAAFRGRERGNLFMDVFQRILMEAVTVLDDDETKEYLFKDAKKHAAAAYMDQEARNE